MIEYEYTVELIATGALDWCRRTHARLEQWSGELTTPDAATPALTRWL